MFRIAFPMPEADEHRRLWQAIIPAKALSSDVDFDDLADKYAMSGGYIKNAAVRAAFRAAGDGAQIAMRHLVKAAGAEYSSINTQGRDAIHATVRARIVDAQSAQVRVPKR